MNKYHCDFCNSKSDVCVCGYKPATRNILVRVQLCKTCREKEKRNIRDVTQYQIE